MGQGQNEPEEMMKNHQCAGKGRAEGNIIKSIKNAQGIND